MTGLLKKDEDSIGLHFKRETHDISMLVGTRSWKEATAGRISRPPDIQLMNLRI
jgi:hypothetical protein